MLSFLLLPLVAAMIHLDMDVRQPSVWDLSEAWTFADPDEVSDDYMQDNQSMAVSNPRLRKRVVSDEGSVTVDDSLIRIKLSVPGAGHLLNVPLLTSQSNSWFFGPENGNNSQELVYDGTAGQNLTDVFGHAMVDDILYDWTVFADYWTDNVTFGPEIGPKNFVFGRSRKMSTGMTPGIGLGPSPPQQRTINGSEYSTSFLDGLVRGGYIERRMFSMYLGHNSTRSQPNVIFGGLDANMVRGDWSTFPLLKEANSTTSDRYFIALTGLSITRQDNTVDTVDMSGDAAVLLDPQYAMSYIPSDAMVNLAVMLGAIFFDGLGGWICDCKLREVGAFINIQLSSITFSMSVYDVLLPITDGFGKPVNFTGGGQACAVTFSSSEFTGYNVLGFNFLRNLYTVYDVDSKEVSIAKLRKGALQSDSYEPNIVPLRGPLDSVMNATTISQPDIDYTYGIPQYNTTKYPTAGGDKMTHVVFSDPTGLVTYEGITVPGTVTGQPRPFDSEAFTIQVSASSTSSKPGALIQILGKPISGSQTMFRDAPPTGATKAKAAQVPPTELGAPRSSGYRAATKIFMVAFAMGISICI